MASEHLIQSGDDSKKKASIERRIFAHITAIAFAKTNEDEDEGRKSQEV